MIRVYDSELSKLEPIMLCYEIFKKAKANIAVIVQKTHDSQVSEHCNRANGKLSPSTRSITTSSAVLYQEQSKRRVASIC